ncbi:MAG: class I adenylate-forming enzyme family protein [Desulfocapsaceae bacterium]
MNVGKLLSKLAVQKDQDSAIIYNDQLFTYGELNDSANSLAGYLVDKGVGNKDTIAVILPNCPEFAFVYFAAAKIGAIFTPIDNRLGENEIKSILDDTKAKVCFVYPGFKHMDRLGRHVLEIDIAGGQFKSIIQAPQAASEIIADIDPTDTALYLHTSGTTGRAKVVELTYANLNCFPEAMENCVVQGEKEILGIILPMSHISGPIILNLLLANRCKLVIIDSINPVSLFENIAKHKITYFHAVPPIFSLMLKSGFSERYDTTSLDLIAMMGTSVPVSLMNAFKKAFPHVVVLQGYGLTETSPLVTLTRREDADNKRASIGTPVEGAEVKVVDQKDARLDVGEIGELVVKGPMVMKGYLGVAEQDNERFKNGYFHTNDLVKFDGDNYFYHMGRRDDLVVLANGQNVYPAEIKNIIFSHPAVLDSEVIGVYSEKVRGNVLHAFVVSTQVGTLADNEIRSLCQNELGSAKTPKHVTILEAIPKTSTGKSNIQELRNLSEKNDR